MIVETMEKQSQILINSNVRVETVYQYLHCKVWVCCDMYVLYHLQLAAGYV